jgi:ATP-binding cassette subfamily F protein 3
MDGELTVLETVDKVAVGEIRTKIRDILGSFMFSGDTVEKKVKILSGGERTRLAMVRLMLEPVNFLVMDEPTNHLDMRSKEILKQALIDFTGTILLVSHDREFLNGLVDCVYEFKDKNIRQHLGGIYEFLEKLKIESLTELDRKTPSNSKMEQQLSNNTGANDSLFTEYEKVKRNLEQTIYEWEISVEQQEEWENKKTW